VPWKLMRESAGTNVALVLEPWRVTQEQMEDRSKYMKALSGVVEALPGLVEALFWSYGGPSRSC
jgi:hypothetical protein